MLTEYGVKRILSALANTFANQQQAGLPWWAWFVIIVVVIFLFVLLWRWLGLSKGGEQPIPATSEPVTQPKSRTASPAVTAEPAPALIAEKPAQIKSDDLTTIEGIGPKISSVLQGAGINTFAQLASMDLMALEATLQAAGMRLADPTSWAEQAKLAADGKLDELKALQDTLKGGRRV